jgi:Protein of unknown function (DUF2783)
MKTVIKTELNLTDPDGFYEAWLNSHEGLDQTESFELNARLILLLANQVGDFGVILQCLRAASGKPLL